MYAKVTGPDAVLKCCGKFVNKAVVLFKPSESQSILKLIDALVLYTPDGSKTPLSNAFVVEQTNLLNTPANSVLHRYRMITKDSSVLLHHK